MTGSGFEWEIDTSGMDRITRDMPEQLEVFLDAEIESIQTDVKLSMGTSPGGRSYSRGIKVHVASQPGYPPNVDTGTLRASLHWERTKEFVRDLMDGVNYGIMLELGTTRMEPRPFLGPAFERVAQHIGRRLRDHLGLS